MKNSIEIENSGYSHRIEYICDTDTGFGIVSRQVYSFYKDDKKVWSQEFPSGVSFEEMGRAFMDSGLYVKRVKGARGGK